MKKIIKGTRKKTYDWKKSLPLTLSAVFFVLLMTATVRYIGFKKVQWENDVRAQLFDTLIGKKTKLEKALFSRIYYTKSVAAYISLRPDISLQEFENLAAELIQNDSVISTMAMSKDCVITALYPSQGHEAAIGLNLLAHPERREIVEKTIETRESYVAGPVELVEGGTAFISYTPIFDKSRADSDPNRFWGVTDIVIYKDPLLNEAQLRPEENGFRFALRGYNGQGSKGAVFWGSEEIFDMNPVTVGIELPYGSWLLAGTPLKGWKTFIDQDRFLLIILIIASSIISLLIWILTRAMVKIRQNEKEMQAIFESLDSLIIEFDQECRYRKIATKNNSLLFLPREELLHKTVFDVFEPETAEMFRSAIQKCLSEKELVVIQYPLTIQGTTKWFTARISYKSPNSVIYNAFDSTEQKNYHDELIASHEKLNNLNITKDKLFSIISHDLKSPFNSMLGFLDILTEQYDKLSSEKVKEILNTLSKTTEETFALLMNLLNWAMAQRGQIRIRPEMHSLKELVESSIRMYAGQAEKKGIRLLESGNPDVEALFDEETMSVVVRNLISNAIKFSHRGGEVHIEYLKDQNGPVICVKDQGVGMAPEDLKNLFSLEKQISSKGTENEKGTGLGLILCKEFTEYNKAHLQVSSLKGKGTSFKILFPNR